MVRLDALSAAELAALHPDVRAFELSLAALKDGQPRPMTAATARSQLTAAMRRNRPLPTAGLLRPPPASAGAACAAHHPLRLEPHLCTSTAVNLAPVACAGLGAECDSSTPGTLCSQQVPLRVFWPAEEQSRDHLGHPPPLLLFIHGGGWVAGTLDDYAVFSQGLCHASGCVLVVVDYRRAPEHPYPAPLEDCVTAYCWAARAAAALGADPGRLAVAGDSAGGHLAAALSLYAASGGLPADVPPPQLQLLACPALGRTNLDSDSYRSAANKYSFLTRDAMIWYWEQLGGAPGCRLHEFLSPLDVDVSALSVPPAIILTAACDPLESDGSMFAARLQAAGCLAQHHSVAGAEHCFFLSLTTELGQRGLCQLAQLIRQHFGGVQGAKGEAGPARPSNAAAALTMLPAGWAAVASKATARLQRSLAALKT